MVLHKCEIVDNNKHCVSEENTLCIHHSVIFYQYPFASLYA